MRKKIGLSIGIVIIAALLVLIWGNSTVMAFDSYKITCKFIGFCTSITGKMGKFGDLISAYLTIHYVRKTAHFIEFAVLGTVCVVFKGARVPMTRERITRLALIGVSVPLIDETIQSIIGRGSSISDIWLDISGFATGAVITALICLLIRRKSQKK